MHLRIKPLIQFNIDVFSKRIKATVYGIKMTYNLIQEFTEYWDEDRDFVFYQVKAENNNNLCHPFLSALVAAASAQETESKTFSEKKNWNIFLLDFSRDYWVFILRTANSASFYQCQGLQKTANRRQYNWRSPTNVRHAFLKSRVVNLMSWASGAFFLIVY